jgi:tartrate-resistant acid phosphatase type 5
MKGIRIIRLLPALLALLLIPAATCAQLPDFVRCAVIGDFYNATANTPGVANLVKSWNPDLIVTTGDNSNNTSMTEMDRQVGQFYGAYIHYPAGSPSVYAPGVVTNAFFPTLGNHDWDGGISGWTDYFELPGNERYYDLVRGPIHFFVIDSDGREWDGNTVTSTQAQWLKARLAASIAPWKVVVLHEPPYSSGSGHGGTPSLQWPFQAWGATIVIAGHDHIYERIEKNGFPYLVVGTGGASLYGFRDPPDPESLVRYNADYGALLIEAVPTAITFRFYSIAGGTGGTLIDTRELQATKALFLPLVIRDKLSE